MRGTRAASAARATGNVRRTRSRAASRRSSAARDTNGSMTPPIDRPGKIIAVGLNYRGHAEEQARETPAAPMLFAKWATALIGPDEPILIPSITTSVDFEGELGVVIGGRVKRASR